MCDSHSSILIALEMTEAKSAMDQKKHASTMSHGAAITLRLCEICGITGSRRVVYGDSFFSSLDTALQLSAHGLHFSGIVKTAHAGFPKSFFKDWCVALSFFPTPIQMNKPYISPFKQVCTWFWNSARRRIAQTAGSTVTFGYKGEPRFVNGRQKERKRIYQCCLEIASQTFESQKETRQICKFASWFAPCFDNEI